VYQRKSVQEQILILSKEKPKLCESKKIGARANFLPKTKSTLIYKLVWNLMISFGETLQHMSLPI
jgi:hypothetical protein